MSLAEENNISFKFVGEDIEFMEFVGDAVWTPIEDF